MKPSLNPVSSYVQLASAGIVKYNFPESAIMRFREIKETRFGLHEWIQAQASLDTSKE